METPHRIARLALASETAREVVALSQFRVTIVHFEDTLVLILTLHISAVVGGAVETRSADTIMSACKLNF